MNPIVSKQFIVRNKKLREGGFEDYNAFLKSELWKEVKERWREKQKKNFELWGKCRACGCTNGLVLHHWSYSKVLKTCFSRLIPLCRVHHQAIHDYTNSHKCSIKVATKKVIKKYKIQ